MKNIKKIAILSWLLLSFSACEEKILDLDPLQNPTNVTFFADESQLQLALNGAYGQLANLRASVENIPLIMYMENVMTDNGLYRITDEQQATQALSNGSHDASSGFGGIYRPLYLAASRCNNLLLNMDKAEGVSAERLDDIRAQALALRAYYYHYLLEFFGDVPFLDFIVVDPDEALIPRTPKADIVASMISDLDEAATLVDAGLSGAQDRVTLAMIHGLKARTALYAGEYTTAAQAADDALNAAAAQGISLHPDYEELFTLAGESSSEIMLRIPYDETFRTHSTPVHFGYRFGSIFSQGLPTQNLVDSYPTANGLPIDQDPAYDPTDPWSNRDPRLRASIVIPGDLWGGYIHESHRDSLEATRVFPDGTATRVTNENCRSAQWPAGLTGYLWRKFVDIDKVAANEFSGDNDFILMRLGEVYLIKAEAEIESNGNLAEARDALNILRARAWGGAAYPMVTENSQAGLRKILRMERRSELANEGFRYIDMIRWRIAEKVRNEPLIGRVLDLANATTVPNIDEDGVVTYPNRSEYDDWRSLLVNGVVDPTGYDARLFGNWQNGVARNFNAPRDYLMPIPQSTIDFYTARGATLTQNSGY